MFINIIVPINAKTLYAYNTIAYTSTDQYTPV